ncbi:MAG: ABC transporter permease subunit [Clostridiales bacterium]|nr:ABC transporter permease subunit [Clostridiales bacterium]
MKNKKLLYLLLLIVLWQIISMIVDQPQLMPDSISIFQKFWEEMINGKLWLYAFYSFAAIIIGLSISIILSLAIALLSIKYTWSMDFFKFLNSILHPLPGIAVLPVLIIWFGVGYSSIFALIIHSVLWPILTNLFSAIETFPKTLSKVGDNYEMGILKKFIFIYIPGTMPSFIAGIKTGWARAFRAVISAEMFFGIIGSSGGIGWYLVKKRAFLDTSGIFAGLIVIILIGMFLESFIFDRIEKLTLEKWGFKI